MKIKGFVRKLIAEIGKGLKKYSVIPLVVMLFTFLTFVR